MSGIPVVLVWRMSREDLPPETMKRHMILPALPNIGHLLTPPGNSFPRNVRAVEWDCSKDGNGMGSTIFVLLDD